MGLYNELMIALGFQLGNGAGIHQDGTVTSQGNMSAIGGELRVQTVGRGLRVAEGANAKQGLSAAMVAGTILVNTTVVTANSRIFLTRQEGGINPGAVQVSARVAGASFTILSNNAGDTGQVAWEIVEPA